MNMDRTSWLRLAVLAKLVKRAPQPPGRTALMKFAYLLQAVKKVPLGYRFSLYNYGPYESSVLSDLSQATTLKAIRSRLVTHRTTYGYQYSPHENLEWVCEQADGVDQYDDAIGWVLDKFGGQTAARLELVSTIVFAERDSRRKNKDVSRATLVHQVKEIKPHFDAEVIGETVDELARDRLIALD